MECLKAILLREGYLRRLEQSVNEWLASGEGSPADSLPDLFDLLRIATLEAVEAVTRWRLAQSGGGHISL